MAQAITNEERTRINQALAKVIAYRNCGKDNDADAWAATLLDLLESSHLLSSEGARKIMCLS